MVLRLAVDLDGAGGRGRPLGAGDGVVVLHLQPVEELLPLGQAHGRELEVEGAGVAPRRSQRPERTPLLLARRRLHHQREIAQAEIVGGAPLHVYPGVGRHLHLAGGRRDAHLREGVGLDGHRDGRSGDLHLVTIRELEPVASRLLDHEGAGQVAPVLHLHGDDPALLRIRTLDGDPGPLHGTVGAGREAHLGSSRRLDRAVAARDLPLGAAGVRGVEVGDLHVAGDGLCPGHPDGRAGTSEEPRPSASQVRTEDEGGDPPGRQPDRERQAGAARRTVGHGAGQVDGAGSLPGAGDVLVGEGGRQASGIEFGPVASELDGGEQRRAERIVPSRQRDRHLRRPPGRAPERPAGPAGRGERRDHRDGECGGTQPGGHAAGPGPQPDDAGEQGCRHGRAPPANGGGSHDRPAAAAGVIEDAGDIGVRPLHVSREQRRGGSKFAKSCISRPRHKRRVPPTGCGSLPGLR